MESVALHRLLRLDPGAARQSEPVNWRFKVLALPDNDAPLVLPTDDDPAAAFCQQVLSPNLLLLRPHPLRKFGVWHEVRLRHLLIGIAEPHEHLVVLQHPLSLIRYRLHGGRALRQTLLRALEAVLRDDGDLDGQG